VKSRERLLLLLAVATLGAALLSPASSQAAFGLRSLSVAALNADGSPDLQAGSHPFAFKVQLTLNQKESGFPEGRLRGVVVDLPAGLVGNPQAVPQCSGGDFEGNSPRCPSETQIGFATAQLNGEVFAATPIYNLTPPVGVAARIGFTAAELNALQDAGLRSSDYGVSVRDQTIPPTTEPSSVTETIWGVPADEGHNSLRKCGSVGEILGCASEGPLVPFLSLPTSCTGPLQTTVHLESVENPGVFVTKSVSSLDENGQPAGLENCGAEPFETLFSAHPETGAADSPTGLEVELGVRQNEEPEGLAAAHLKDVSVTLPTGLAVNPSAANGLLACPLQGGEGINLPLSTDPQVPEPAAVGEAAKCPSASKVGTVKVQTPLLDHPVSGSVYLAKQGENPFGSLIALYIALEDPQSGVIVKIPGKVEPDPATGQLKATFLNNPQLPFERLKFNFFGGPRAALTTPATCGEYATNALLTPWSAPEGATATQTSSFAITSSASGGPCAGGEGQLPNAPGFEAGTTQAMAGAYAPFVFKISRENGSQRIRSIEATLPEGVVGKLAGIPYCSDAAIAAASGRSALGDGAVEQNSPSCPLGSEVGTVTVGAGSGAPIYVQGHVYLAGPYKSAPLSLEIITPAVAGPFDLGTVAVRTALYVNESSAQIHAVSDPIPSILAGVPLDVRSIALNMNRPQFTLNPTDCDAMQVLATSISTVGQIASLSNRFQVGGCKGLDFEPALKLSFSGQTKRTGFPAIKAVLTQPKGENANVAGTTVVLPKGMLIANAHINNPCTRVQFNSTSIPGQGCPAKSILGSAKAWTPLLEKPEEGKVYFRSNGGERQLPDMVVALRGQIPLQLVGFIDSVGKKHAEVRRVRSRFLNLPDAPVSRFELKLSGGKKGLLENSKNLCRAGDKATFKLTGQNGKTYDTEPKVQVSCGKRHKRSN
jgi:hypothetical protein